MAMKILFLILPLLLPAVLAGAQPTFSSASLPANVGQYVRAYYSTNVNVASMLALTNGAQQWDFSQPQQTYETVMRTDIVGPNDAGDAADIPAATYAERDTLEPANEIAWRYYSLTNQGRLYYGLDNPLDVNASPIAVFEAPTVDIPASVQYGQNWNRTVDWTSLYFGFIVVSNHFTDASTVDAYGTLALPAIGSVPALRVHEVHTYHAYELISGGSPYLLDVHTNQYYYWLVPGLGVAAQVFLFGDNALAPGGLPNTNSVLRVFASNYFTNQIILGSVAGLRIRLQAGTALLDWQAVPNASRYQVESTGDLGNSNWQVSGSPNTNDWSEAVNLNQRFYRVFGLQ